MKRTQLVFNYPFFFVIPQVLGKRHWIGTNDRFVILNISNGTRIVNDIYILKIFTRQKYQETYSLRLLENSKKIYLLRIRDITRYI